MDTRHFVESFSLHVEQEALLCFVLKAILEFGALITWAPTENRLLGNTFELPLTRRESSDLVNFLLEWTGFDSALKISLILYNSLSPVSHPKFSGQPYDLEFFLEGMLYWISTATSPSDGKDLRRPLCAGVDTPIARSAEQVRLNSVFFEQIFRQFHQHSFSFPFLVLPFCLFSCWKTPPMRPEIRCFSNLKNSPFQVCWSACRD